MTVCGGGGRGFGDGPSFRLGGEIGKFDVDDFELAAAVFGTHHCDNAAGYEGDGL